MSFTDLFEGSRDAAELVHGVDGYKQHRRHGHAPSQDVGPMGEDVIVVLEARRGHRAGDHHKLTREGQGEKDFRQSGMQN